MEAKDFLNLFLDKLWLVIIFVVVGIGSALIYNYLTYVPLYESGTVLYFLDKDKAASKPHSTSTNETTNYSIKYEDVQLDRQFLQDYALMIKTNKVLNSALDELKLKSVTTDKLSDAITVSYTKDSSLLYIKVIWSNPNISANIANIVTKVFIEKMNSITKMDRTEIIDNAFPSKTPVSSPVIKIAVIGFGGGLGLSLLIIYLIGMFSKLRRVDNA
jgi:capsular polysaccharide biosynthesis protein